MILSFAFVAVHVAYPVFTAKQLTALTCGIVDRLIFATLVIFGFDLLAALRMFLIRHCTQVYFRSAFKRLQLACGREILQIRMKNFD